MKILNSKSRGVTLIELAIVLAILGVLIVATISGKSLVDISRATATIQQMRDRALAFQIFNSTYDCVPGDCVDAQAKLSLAGALNGNGDTVININTQNITATGTTTSTAGNGEVAYVEYHLVAAGLFNRTIPAISPNLALILPKTKIGNAYISTVSAGSNYYNIIGTFTTANAVLVTTGPDTSTPYDQINTFPVVPATLRIVDAKIDDSVASTGSVTCYTTYTPATTGALFTLPAAATDYSANCFLAAKMDF